MLAIPGLLDRLAEVFGEPAQPPRRTLLELVVWENVAYLADDTARAHAFELLRTSVGISPEQLLAAPDSALEAVTGHGILAANHANKLRQIGRIARDEFDGNLESVRDLPLAKASRALMRFPSIGQPGAEKILLFGRAEPVLGLESNGVRVVTRLGLVAEGRNYAATYRQVQRLVAPLADRG